MGMNGIKNWLGNKLLDLSLHILPKNQATSLGGVEYNPYLFQDSIEMLITLRQRIDMLEQKSEQLHNLNQLKKQINLLRQDTDQSILETYSILQQIGKLLSQYSDDLKLIEKTGNEKPKSNLSPTKRLNQVALFRKKLRKHESVLLRNHRNLSGSSVFLIPKRSPTETETCFL